MTDSNSDNTAFGALSQAVKHHKVVNEVVDSMYKAVEDYANNRKLESILVDIKNMLKDGIPLKKVLKYTGIDEATYKEHT